MALKLQPAAVINMNRLVFHIAILSVLLSSGAFARVSDWELSRLAYCRNTLEHYGFSTDTPEKIIEAANSDAYVVRHMALRLLAYHAGEKAVPELKRALSDKHVKVRRIAAHLLGKFGDKSGLERMRLDFKELVPRNGALQPADPNITKEPDALKEWERDRRYRIRHALEAAKVMAELGDRTGYDLAAKEAFRSIRPSSRMRAVWVLKEIAKKTDEAVLSAEGKDPVGVLCEVVSSEKEHRVWRDAVNCGLVLGGSKGLRILEKAKDCPHQTEAKLELVRRSFKRMKARLKKSGDKPEGAGD